MNTLRKNLLIGYPDFSQADIMGNLPAPMNFLDVTFEDGPITGEKRAVFDGNDYLAIPAIHTALYGYGLRSWTVKFGMNIATHTTVTIPLMIGLKGDGTGRDGMYFETDFDGKPSIAMALSDGSYINVSSDTIVCDGTDHDILFQWDRPTKTLSLYIDTDEPITGQVTDDIILGGGPDDTTNALWIGTSGVLDDKMTGSIYSLGVWGEAIVRSDVNLVQSRLPMAQYEDFTITDSFSGIANGVSGGSGIFRVYEKVSGTATGIAGGFGIILELGLLTLSGTAAGIADGSGTFTLLESITIPPIPYGLIITAISNSQISIVWTEDGILAIGFEIWRKLNDDDYVLLVTIDNIRSHMDSDISIDNTYTYKIKAIGIDDISDFSAERTITLSSLPRTIQNVSRGGGSILHRVIKGGP